MPKFFTLVISLISLSTFAGAQDKIDTDRPDQTESAFTVPRYYFQGEFGFNKENSSGRNYDLLHPTALLKYGFKRFEVRLEVSSRTSYIHLIPDPQTISGFDPISVGFKVALWEEKGGRPKTSLIASTSLPTIASKEFRTPHLAPAFRFTMQHTINKTISIGYNLGAEWDGFNKAPSGLYTFTTGFSLGEKWYAYAEAFGFIHKNEKPHHNLDGGLAYTITNNTKVDISGGFGISDEAPKSYVAIGFSFRIRTKTVLVNSNAF